MPAKDSLAFSSMLHSLFRMSVKYEPNNTKALLTINPVEILDEASYKCEITYLEVRENCDVVQIIRLQTLGECGT